MEEDLYTIDWSKITNFDQLKEVLSSLEFIIPSSYTKRQQISEYLILVEK